MKQLAKKEETAVATVADLGDLQINKKDLLLPKILLLQGTSALVNEGKFGNGDIINSLTEEKLGDKTKSIEIVPLSNFSTWTILEKGTGKFVKSIPYVKGQELEYEEMLADGKIVNNFYTINCYALLDKELKEGASLPVLISFRSKSLMTGKKLVTSHFLFCQMNGAAPYAKSIQLGCTLQKNEKGSFHVFSLSPGKKTTPEVIASAKMWDSLLKQGDIRVDEEAETKTEANEVVDGANPKY